MTVLNTITTEQRNLVINGNMDFWQRGTSFSLSAANYSHRTADRWNLGKDTTPSAVVVSQSSTVPTVAQSGFQSNFSLLVTNNAVGNSPGAGDGMFLTHRIEGNDYVNLHARKIRVQFWVHSSVIGTYSLLLSNKIPSATMRIYATTYTVNVANTWELKTFDITTDNTGVWSFDNSIGLVLLFGLTGGASVLTSTLNSWHTASSIEGSLGQVNWTGTANATFRLAQVAVYPLDVGSGTDLPFQRAGRTIANELQMCQRYYFGGSSTGQGTSLTTAGVQSTGFSEDATVMLVKFNGGNGASNAMNFPVAMRAVPTISFSDGTNINKCFLAAISASTAGSSNQTPPSGTAVYATNWRFNSGGFTFPNAGDLSTVGILQLFYVANAEI